MSKPSDWVQTLSTASEDKLGRTIVSGVLFLPFLVNWIAQLLGFEIFYVADPKIQVVWGSLAQLFGGFPLYRQVWHDRGEGGRSLALWAALLATLLFLVSLYTALLRPEFGVYFSLSALVIFAYFASRWGLARRRG